MTFALDADTPLLLLPVRLEARYLKKHLRVRVLPDVVHGDDHETDLTANERVAGFSYWQDVFAAPEDQAVLVLTHEGGLQGLVGGHRFSNPEPKGPAWAACPRPRPG